MSRTRVLIVNPTPIIRAALTASLHQQPDLEVVGAVADAYAARDAIAAADPFGSGAPVLAVSCQNSHHVNLWTLAPRAADANGPERTVALEATVDLGAGRGPLDLVSVPRPDGSSWLAVGANFSNELLLYGPR